MARKKKNAGAVPLTSPQTREEHYLANIAGLVETKPEYPFTRTERYLDVISGSTSGLSDRVTALENGKLNSLGKGDNILINAHFYRPVNQRRILYDTWIGATDPATFNFIDSWKLTSGRAKLTAAGIVLEGTMIQTLEFSPHGDVIATALTTDGYVTPVYNPETKVFAITATGETLVAAKLELGEVQTLYSGTTLLDTAPNYQQELAKCQRYLWLEANVSANSYICANGVSNTTTSAIFTLFLPQNLRESGDTTVIANSVAVYSNTDNSTRNCTAVRVASLVGNNVGISATISGATPGESVRLVVIQGGSFGISKEV